MTLALHFTRASRANVRIVRDPARILLIVSQRSEDSLREIDYTPAEEQHVAEEIGRNAFLARKTTRSFIEIDVIYVIISSRRDHLDHARKKEDRKRFEDRPTSARTSTLSLQQGRREKKVDRENGTRIFVGMLAFVAPAGLYSCLFKDDACLVLRASKTHFHPRFRFFPADLRRG